MAWGIDTAFRHARTPGIPATTGTLSVPVVFALGGATSDLVVEACSGATAEALLVALAGDDLGPGARLLVDGRPVDSDDLLVSTGIRAGSRLEVRLGPTLPAVAPSGAGEPGTGSIEVRVVGGIAAGRRWTLGRGAHVIGRAETCDIHLDSPTVSGHHAIVDIDVDGNGAAVLRDTESTNGTWVDGEHAASRPLRGDVTGRLGLARLGAVELEFRRAPAAIRRRRPGAFNRPPRITHAAATEPLRPPVAPVVVGSRPRFSWTAILLPVVMGIGLAVLWDPRMAAFALFSPVFAVGNWLEERRRGASEGRRSAHRLAADLESFRTALDAALAEEIARRNEVARDPAALVTRIEEEDTALWQRRLASEDAFVVRLGTGREGWRPPVSDERAMAPDAAELLNRVGELDGPVLVELSPGSVAGIVAPSRATARAIGRSVVLQFATHLGPADLRIAILTTGDDGAVEAWRWGAWLPHTRGAGDASDLRLLASNPGDTGAVLAALRATAASDPAGRGSPAIVLIVDDPALLAGSPSPLRSLLASGDVTGLVCAATEDDLPASCTHLLVTDSDGLGRLVETRAGRRVDGMLATGVDLSVATRAAHVLASVDDPEMAGAHAGLPASVDALVLLDLEPSATAIGARWAAFRGADRPALPVTIGLTAEGPLTLDLVADGPHGLLGGTTGSGKSELLRTLVASLAATVPPDRLNIVLVDYKGGSAFDACARLPHTVGVVTDLDDHLGQRALRCLEAELRHREQVLRDAGAVDLVHHHAIARDPLPRLLVVIDEFATMAAELPDFVDALVGIAQRGRSLGVHLLLGTQRPAGAVKDNIRANTNLRVALRMQDAADSNDVLGRPDAASLSRRIPGRGYARLGPAEIVPFQTALVSGRSNRADRADVVVRPLRFAPDGERADSACGDHGGIGDGGGDGDALSTPTDLDRLVAAAVEAATQAGIVQQRRAWPDPLPTRLEPDEVVAQGDAAGNAVIGMADEPSRQRTAPFAWDPAGGNLHIIGTPGSGSTSALLTITARLAARMRAASLHVYALDFGAGGLSPLTALPHTGAVVGATEVERQRRLVRLLRDELDARRSIAGDGNEACQGPDGATPARILFLLDGWAGFAAAFDDAAGMDLRNDVARIVADGPAVGITTIVTAEQATTVPLAMAGGMASKLVLRLGDRHDWSAFGVAPSDIPTAVPGRGFDTASAREVQLTRPPTATELDAIARTAGQEIAGNRPRPIGTLPAKVGIADVLSAASGAPTPPLDCDAPWEVPLGVSGTTLTPAMLRFHPGDAATVSGPSRSGRSTALVTIVAAARASDPTVAITAVALRPSPLRSAEGLGTLITEAAHLERALRTATAGAACGDLHADLSGARRRHLVVIDDADGVEDAGGWLAGVIAANAPGVHLIAAGRPDALRSAYGHWTRHLRRSRLGIALLPNVEDGDLFGTTWSRRQLPVPRPGCGLLVVDGIAEPVQVAVP